MLRILPLIFACFLCSFLLVSCASEHNFRAADATEPTPRFLELADEQSFATVHFPRGLYLLDSVDDTGYYYRSAQRVMKHSFGGSYPQEGGIFVSKRNGKARGYIVWAAGLTKIGNVGRSHYRLRS